MLEMYQGSHVQLCTRRKITLPTTLSEQTERHHSDPLMAVDQRPRVGIGCIICKGKTVLIGKR